MEHHDAILEWIEIENFLSFRKSRIRLLRDDGSLVKFLVLTGPNGGGKTSIFQALKFVLGSNNKDKRYETWEEFINRDEDFMRVRASFKTRGGERHEIGRTIRRGRGSSYSLNGSPVQLKTIEAIVKQLRISPDNIFTFIVQGQVNAIRDLPADKIFQLVEWGMGVDRMKEEIQHNADDLQNKRTLLAQLETQLENCIKNERVLQDQFRVLQKKRFLRSELVKLNAEMNWARREDVNMEIEALQHALDQNGVLLQGHLDEKRTIEEEISRLDEKRTEIKEIIETRKALEHDLRLNKQDIDAEIKKLDDEKRILFTRVESLKTQIDERETAIKELEKERKVLEQGLEQNKDKRANLSKKKEEKQRKREGIKQDLDIHKEWFENHSSLERKRDAHQHELGDVEKDIEVNEAALAGFIDRIGDVNQYMKGSEWYFSAEYQGNPKKVLTSRIKQLEKEISGKQNQLDASKKDESECRKLTGGAQHDGKETSMDLRKIESVVEEIGKRGLNERVKGPIYSFLEFDPAHARAIEAVFKKNALLGFVTFTKHDFHLISSIRAKFKVTSRTYLVEDDELGFKDRTPPDHPGVVDFLFNLIKVPTWLEPVISDIVKDTLVVTDLPSGTNYLEHGGEYRCVTLDGHTLKHERKTISSDPPYYGRMILIQGETGEPSTAEVKLNRLVEFNVAMEKELGQLQKEIGEAKHRLEQAERIRILINQKETLGRQKDACDEKKKGLRDDKKRVEGDLKAINDEIARVEKLQPPHFKDLTQELDTVQKEIDSLQNELDAKKDEQLSLEKTFQECMFKLNEKQEKINALNEMRGELLVELEKGSGYYKELQEKFDKVRDDLKNIQKEIECKENEKKEIIDTISSKKNGIDEKEALILSIREEREKLHVKMIGLEEQRKYIEDNLKDMVKPDQLKSVETYKYLIRDVEDELASPEYYYIDESIEGEIEENSRKISAISDKKGEVQHETEETIRIGDELKQHYMNLMKKHIEDLQTHVNDKLARLQMAYRVLFEASQDYSKPGIKISVDFFTSKPFPITSLSEGQKSLISITLILTLQELNPGPVCFFDEAHIFLDDKNKENIINLIRIITEKVQFIITIPSTKQNFITTADQILGVCREGQNFHDDSATEKDVLHLGRSYVFECV
nr:chromosome segregation SMC family protein [Candidatus Sigynarchaeota archaeon]